MIVVCTKAFECLLRKRTFGSTFLILSVLSQGEGRLHTLRNGSDTCVIASRYARIQTFIALEEYILLSTVMHCVKGAWLLVNKVLEGCM